MAVRRDVVPRYSFPKQIICGVGFWNLQPVDLDVGERICFLWWFILIDGTNDEQENAHVTLGHPFQLTDYGVDGCSFPCPRDTGNI